MSEWGTYEASTPATFMPRLPVTRSPLDLREGWAARYREMKAARKAAKKKS